jgi:hypothetical protein
MLQRFLDPASLAGISGLDLVAKTVVHGFVAGLHRFPDFGFSQEFAENCASPGEQLRRVDWNVYARTERLYLRRAASHFFLAIHGQRDAAGLITFDDEIRNEVVLFHVLDPEDVRSEMNGPSILVDMETGERLEVQAHLCDLGERTQSAGMRGGRN